MKRYQIMRSGERMTVGNQQRLELFLCTPVSMKGRTIKEGHLSP
jgi:hypothetical protein